VDYAKLLEMDSFFTWHIFLQVGKTEDLPSKIWQTLGVALMFVTQNVDILKSYAHVQKICGHTRVDLI
jgi:hypothetical protein